MLGAGAPLATTLANGASYGLHLCAADGLLACSPPYRFIVDLTLPERTAPVDLAAGRAAGALFGVLSAIGGTWSCADPDGRSSRTWWAAYVLPLPPRAPPPPRAPSPRAPPPPCMLLPHWIATAGDRVEQYAPMTMEQVPCLRTCQA